MRNLTNLERDSATFAQRSSVGEIQTMPSDARNITIVSDAWFPQINGVVRVLSSVRQELEAMGHRIEIIAPDRFRRSEVAEGCAGGAEGRSKRLICLRGTWMEDTGGKSGRRPGRHLQVEASGPGNARPAHWRLAGRSRRGEVVEGCAGGAAGRSKGLICLRVT